MRSSVSLQDRLIKDIIRKTFNDGGVEEVISTRRLVHIVQHTRSSTTRPKLIWVCLNRFDDETKLSFVELYDKVDVEFSLDTPDQVEDSGILDILNYELMVTPL